MEQHVSSLNDCMLETALTAAALQAKSTSATHTDYQRNVLQRASVVDRGVVDQHMHRCRLSQDAKCRAHKRVEFVHTIVAANVEIVRIDTRLVPHRPREIVVARVVSAALAAEAGSRPATQGLVELSAEDDEPALKEFASNVFADSGAAAADHGDAASACDLLNSSLGPRVHVD